MTPTAGLAWQQRSADHRVCAWPGSRRRCASSCVAAPGGCRVMVVVVVMGLEGVHGPSCTGWRVARCCHSTQRRVAAGVRPKMCTAGSNKGCNVSCRNCWIQGTI
jgi:hypothetical protein